MESIYGTGWVFNYRDLISSLYIECIELHIISYLMADSDVMRWIQHAIAHAGKTVDPAFVWPKDMIVVHAMEDEYAIHCFRTSIMKCWGYSDAMFTTTFMPTLIASLDNVVLTSADILMIHPSQPILAKLRLPLSDVQKRMNSLVVTVLADLHLHQEPRPDPNLVKVIVHKNPVPLGGFFIRNFREAIRQQTHSEDGMYFYSMFDKYFLPQLKRLAAPWKVYLGPNEELIIRI